MTTMAIIGAGAWGTALAVHAARQGHAVRLWAREPEVVEQIRAQRENKLFLPDIRLPDAVAATGDPAEAVAGADVAVLVPPSSHLRAVARSVAPHLRRDAVVVVASKGIEEGTLALTSQVLESEIPDLGPARAAFLSGPSFAREVAKGQPTDVVVASRALATARAVQRLLHAPLFRVYTSVDPVGVQIGGAVKNVIAIAAGACDGMELGANARAALLTRGLAEITRLGVALGANPLTFLGLSGMGDLLLTCTGALSRNRALGLKVAEGVRPREYLAGVRAVAEGFSTAAAAHALSRRLGVDMPITEQIYHVLHEDRPLLEALRLLVTREHKDELLGIQDVEPDHEDPGHEREGPIGPRS